MAQVNYPTKYFLGTDIFNPKVYYKTIKSIIDNLNSVTTGSGVISATTLTISGLSKLGPVVEKHTASAINASATATAAQIATGYITSTSALATSITLPTAAELVAVLGATAGSSFEFIVDNSAGANTVTIVGVASITVNTPAITGGATLTVSTANAVGIFRLIFTSTTAAKILRVA